MDLSHWVSSLPCSHTWRQPCAAPTPQLPGPGGPLEGLSPGPPAGAATCPRASRGTVQDQRDGELFRARNVTSMGPTSASEGHEGVSDVSRFRQLTNTHRDVASMAASHRAETRVFCHPEDARRGAWQRERPSLQPERVSRVQTHRLPRGCAWGDFAVSHLCAVTQILLSGRSLFPQKVGRGAFLKLAPYLRSWLL